MMMMKKIVLMVLILVIVVAGAAPAAFAKPEEPEETESELSAAQEEEQPTEEAEPEADEDECEAKPGSEAKSGAEETEEPTADPQSADEIKLGCKEEPTDGKQEIVGGHHVGTSEYPFIAALLDKRRGDSAREQHICGGTLISINTVLTAAHCVEGMTEADLQVAVGRTVLSNSDEGELRRVSFILKHPDYNPKTFENDVAIIRLNKPIIEGATAVPADESHDRYERLGTLLKVAGWGNTIAQPADKAPGSAGKKKSDQLQWADVPVVMDSTANGVYIGDTFQPTLMIAAGQAGKSSCTGDSGGPLFANNGSEYVVVGIASHGLGCAQKDYPIIYTEVNAPSIRNFITRHSGV